ncbi:Vacuolar protein sorting-associated protein 41 [Neolecta irregularis DAH-3]|uniref:Vacuolar protein sorting-associated protein 41 n=1 Tax=Neolecta irregularis (strain DAH-3) TaxID=1198029 RepID=A0A1U7LHV2_NEOID|nr:Vacuolar protein sorting-associated protein 41 [Neolecta irregularis DAH-3]|eukprot:OLL22208.1 Vacuolar protein sorting-associated protein 41 [Neolecta irregularis DAH-3]
MAEEGNPKDLEESVSTDEADDSEDEEQRLKYTRINGDIPELLKFDAISACAISKKILVCFEERLVSPQVVGTHNGRVYVFDFNGTQLQRFNTHSAAIFDLSIDSNGAFVASASMDGRVAVHEIETKEIHAYEYKRPIRSVAVDPNYGRHSARQFVCGGAAGQLILTERGWLGRKDNVLSQDDGTIMEIQWRNEFIAWADDISVKVWHTGLSQLISVIQREPNAPRPDLYKCHITWKNDRDFLIGWAGKISVISIQKDPSRVPIYFEEVRACFDTDSIVSGILPFGIDLLILSYVEEDADPGHERRRAEKPELRLINPSHEEVSGDALGLNDYIRLQPNDLHLCRSYQSNVTFVVSPTDIVSVKARDGIDHVEWLLERERYQDALAAVRQMRSPPAHLSVREVGVKYMESVYSIGNYNEAARIAPDVFEQDKEMWEKWFYKFSDDGHLEDIVSVLPTKDLHLNPAIYEQVLSYFLENNPEKLLETIKIWPDDIYNIDFLISQVEDLWSESKDDRVLMNCLAELKMLNNSPKDALHFYLRLRRPDTFDLIRQNHLLDSLQNDILLLMLFDTETVEIKDNIKRGSTTKAVELLVQHVHTIPAKKVVSQIKDYSLLLHLYLDGLFDADPHLSSPWADEQIGLYAEYDRPKLMDFLRTSTSYSLEHARQICDQRNLIPELVFIYSRMGNNKKALMLIIEKLQDVQRAIEFAKMQDDIDLWEDFLNYSMDKPRTRPYLRISRAAFIRGLLENTNQSMDPIKLIKRIPKGLEIQGLKSSLVKILHDFELEVSLSVGCANVLEEEIKLQTRELSIFQKKGMAISLEAVCGKCDLNVLDQGDKTSNFKDNKGIGEGEIIGFFCKHVYHRSCLLEENDDTVQFNVANFHATSIMAPIGVADKITRAAIIKNQLTNGCPNCLRDTHNTFSLRR